MAPQRSETWAFSTFPPKASTNWHLSRQPVAAPIQVGSLGFGLIVLDVAESVAGSTGVFSGYCERMVLSGAGARFSISGASGMTISDVI